MPTFDLITGSLQTIDWPADAVFIVDANLPAAVERELPGPTLLVDAGEALKSFAQVEVLARRVLEVRAARPLTLIAVGGGSLGDAVGFLASVLFRGVPLWHVPSTLLAMVDSAHGGKTAVNLDGYKNLLGTFYPAERTVIALPLLHTLPLDQREEGLVELLKTLWLEAPDHLRHFDSPEDLHHLLCGDVPDHAELWSTLITAAAAAKMTIVDADPREETGHRMILNLGHTAGHGVEALFRIPHGRAIAWGLAAAALLSRDHAGLSQADTHRLLLHVEPFLQPLPTRFSPDHRCRFNELLASDKKRRAAGLTSVLLEAPGAPIRTTALTSDHWWEALREVTNLWHGSTYEIHSPQSSQSLESVPRCLPVDKSLANRAQAIAHLREGTTTFELPPEPLPTDVWTLRDALHTLEETIYPGDTARVDAGEGGTTARFLLAVAAHRPDPTVIHLGPQLATRPQGPLLQALRDGGAVIEEQERAINVRGWLEPPTALYVDARTSSQFASALALLSATDSLDSLLVRGPIASRPYLDLTLEMLRDAGVVIEEEPDGDHQRFSFFAVDPWHPATLSIPRDASAAVLWQTLSVLHDGEPWPVDELGVSGEHPDAGAGQLFHSLLTGPSSATVDLQDRPDLATVLASFATSIDAAVEVVGAPHLRHKESDRISDLRRALSAVGVEIEERPDGFLVPAGIQHPTPGATFPTFGDHRLAMAGLVLASRAPHLKVESPQVVAKSYPLLWRDARRAGFRLSCDWGLDAD